VYVVGVVALNEWTIFVAQPDGTVEVRGVAVSMTSDGQAVIAQGLKAGEEVVREGQFLLGPGSRIEIKNTTGLSETSGNTDEKVKGERKSKGKRS
jgi:hypothetical protein